jgi:hypothetical protein
VRPRVEALEDRLVPTTLVVSSTADSGGGTLRAAIAAANQTPGLVTIDFAIGAHGSFHTINLATQLPAITGTVIINGASQGGTGYSGQPLIELNGAGAPKGACGLTVVGNGCKIEGLRIDRFDADGILLNGNASRNTIGGAAAGAGNVIFGNHNDGIELVNPGVTNTRIEGNHIGTDFPGTAALPNRFDGILIRNGSSNNTIGGGSHNDRNIISANGNDGIEIVNTGSANNLIERNLIGTQADGASHLGNGRDGVAVRVQAANNTISSNVIAFNHGNGVLVGDHMASGTAGTGNTIEGNSIVGNHRLGIFLGFDNLNLPPVVLVNGILGHPALNNSYQNYPVLSTPQVTADSTVLSGTVVSPNNAGTTLRIEFFASSSADPSGFGQGQRFLGSVTVTTMGNGFGSFKLTLPVRLASGQVISATATDTLGNTSEFARNVRVP